MLLIIALVVFILVLIKICLSVRKPYNFPPGPPWLPIVGSIPYIQKYSKKVRQAQHIVLQEMCKEFNSNVLGLKLGEQLLIVVCSYPIMRKILENDAYNARPNIFFAKLRTIGTGPGITSAEGKVWTEQKRFIVHHLYDLAKQIMEVQIMEELDDVVKTINEKNDEVEIGRLLQPAVINLIWFLVAGTRIEKGNPQFTRLLDLLDRRSKAFDMSGGVMSQFPWLRFVIPERIGYNLIKRLNVELREFLMEAIEEHQRNWTDGDESDLMYSFITEMKAREGTASNFTNDQLLMICLDLFVAGAHSTSSTLDNAFLMVLLHQDVQKKIQTLLEEHFHQDHQFKPNDWQKVPYIQAVLLEVQRYCSVLPMASRRVSKDVVLEGYNVPKDTTVLINLHSVLMDKDIWGDPEVFRPERFFHKDKLIVFDEFVPFSTGRRRCLGEPFAKTCLFIFFVEILRKYFILPVKGKPLPTVTPSPGIVSLPQRFTAQFLPRF